MYREEPEKVTEEREKTERVEPRARGRGKSEINEQKLDKGKRSEDDFWWRLWTDERAKKRG